MKGAKRARQYTAILLIVTLILSLTVFASCFTRVNPDNGEADKGTTDVTESATEQVTARPPKPVVTKAPEEEQDTPAPGGDNEQDPPAPGGDNEQDPPTPGGDNEQDPPVPGGDNEQDPPASENEPPKNPGAGEFIDWEA